MTRTLQRHQNEPEIIECEGERNMKLRRDGKRERRGFARVGKVTDTFKGIKNVEEDKGESKHSENKINFGRARH